jgi:hypothetical protein
MSECMARQGEFCGYSEGERDAVIHDFRQIILDADVYGFSCGVSLRDWDHLVGTRSLIGLRDPLLFCMSTAITWACNFARRFSAKVTFVLDDMPERKEVNEHIFSVYHQGHNKEIGREDIAGISFLSSENFVGLQGADMVAWETYNYAKGWLQEGVGAPTRPHLTPLAQSGRVIALFGGPRAIQEIKEWLAKLQTYEPS